MSMASPLRGMRFLVFLLICSIPALLSAADGDSTGGEEQAEDPAEAVTIADTDIPVDELDLLLTPLTRDQLAVEAAAWRALLEERVREVSNAEIAIKRKTEEIAVPSVQDLSLVEPKKKKRIQPTLLTTTQE